MERLLLLLWLILATRSTCVRATVTMAKAVDGKLEGQVLHTLKGTSLSRCVTGCRNMDGCKGFNRQASSGTCDLLSTRLCENDLMTLSTVEADWRYYDLQDASYPDPNHVFYNHSMCTERGMCSTACERGIDQSCTDDIQCQVLTDNSHCTATSPTSPGICSCKTHHWKYNATLCIHQTSLESNIWSWIFKKVVNNMCSVTFTARVQKDIWIHLGSFDDWHSGISQYYFILGGWGNTQSIFDKDGTRMVTVATNGLCTNNYQNFTLHWCSGYIRVSQQGGGAFIAWDDPAPFPVKTLGFRLPYPNGHAHMFFPHNLVDPYFPTSAETGVIRTNGYHWLEYKIMPDASLVTSINFTFECMAVKDCQVIFSRWNDHTQKYQVYFGAYSNTRSLINNNAAHVVDIQTPDIVSGTEFRKFWIRVNGNTIHAGNGNEDTPAIMSYTDPGAARTYSHVSVATCCNDYGYWKIHSHSQFHEYPNGAYTVP